LIDNTLKGNLVMKSQNLQKSPRNVYTVFCRNQICYI